MRTLTIDVYHSSVIVTGGLYGVRSYVARLFVAAAFCFMAELLHACYTKALIANSMAAAVSLSFFLPFITFVGAVWFIEEKAWNKRIGYVGADGVGYALGTLMVMTFWS